MLYAQSLLALQNWTEMFKASSKWLGYLVDVIALCAGSDAEWICFKR